MVSSTYRIANIILGGIKVVETRTISCVYLDVNTENGIYNFFRRWKTVRCSWGGIQRSYFMPLLLETNTGRRRVERRFVWEVVLLVVEIEREKRYNGAGVGIGNMYWSYCWSDWMWWLVDSRWCLCSRDTK